MMESVRARALRFFKADPAHWDLVFTANATAAIKLVAECFEDHGKVVGAQTWYGFHIDAHTSLVGMKQMFKAHKCFQSNFEVEQWMTSSGFGGAPSRSVALFAYPGQSNMTGRRLPLSWAGRIRRQVRKSKTYTLLDAAALASTCPLDLSSPDDSPDFVALSFYKIFGQVDLGALLVQKQSQHVLQDQRYFGGGTVDMVITVGDSWHQKKAGVLHERLEHGTPAFHSINELGHAMTVYERMFGLDPMRFISMHTSKLAAHFYESLVRMRHANGARLIQVYNDYDTDAVPYADPTKQGSTVTFNILKADGSLFGYADVERAANKAGLCLRSGSLCNPGGFARYHGWAAADMRRAYEAGHRCSSPVQVIAGRATGVVRVSFGVHNIDADSQAALTFLSETYINHDASIPRPDSKAASLCTAIAVAPASAMHAEPPRTAPNSPLPESRPNSAYRHEPQPVAATQQGVFMRDRRARSSLVSTYSAQPVVGLGVDSEPLPPPPDTQSVTTKKNRLLRGFARVVTTDRKPPTGAYKLST